MRVARQAPFRHLLSALAGPQALFRHPSSPMNRRPEMAHERVAASPHGEGDRQDENGGDEDDEPGSIAHGRQITERRLNGR